MTERELESIIRRLQDAQKDLEAFERRRAQEAAERLSPEERRRRFRVIRGGAAAAVIGAATAAVAGWMRQWARRPEQVVLVASVTVAVGVLVGPAAPEDPPPRLVQPVEPRDEPEASLEDPAHDAKVTAELDPGPAAEPSATVPDGAPPAPDAPASPARGPPPMEPDAQAPENPAPAEPSPPPGRSAPPPADDEPGSPPEPNPPDDSLVRLCADVDALDVAELRLCAELGLLP